MCLNPFDFQNMRGRNEKVYKRGRERESMQGEGERGGKKMRRNEQKFSCHMNEKLFQLPFLDLVPSVKPITFQKLSF